MITLLAAAAIGLRHLSHGEAGALAQPLSRFPVQLGDWRGHDVPIEPRVVRALGVSDYLNRLYEQPPAPSIFLYIAYFSRQRTGQVIHSPKNCLPSAGWEPVSVGSIDLTGPQGTRVVVNRYIIQNGLQREVVLYWYQSHGRIVASEYWGKVYLILDAIKLNRTDAALVRISTPVIAMDDTSSASRAVEFAENLLARSRGLIPD